MRFVNGLARRAAVAALGLTFALSLAFTAPAGADTASNTKCPTACVNVASVATPAQAVGETASRPAGSLPFTGDDALDLVIVGALALGLGTVAMWISRRRPVAANSLRGRASVQ